MIYILELSNSKATVGEVIVLTFFAEISKLLSLVSFLRKQ